MTMLTLIFSRTLLATQAALPVLALGSSPNLAGLFLSGRGSTSRDVPACYFPSGEMAEGNSPCPNKMYPDLPFVHCCGDVDSCLDNGLCKVNTSDNLGAQGTTGIEFARGACTDQAWASQNCLGYCRTSQPGSPASNGAAVFACNGTGVFEWLDYCCENGVNSKASCCTGSTFALRPGSTTYSSMTVPTGSTTTTTTAAPSTTTTASLTKPITQILQPINGPASAANSGGGGAVVYTSPSVPASPTVTTGTPSSTSNVPPNATGGTNQSVGQNTASISIQTGDHTTTTTATTSGATQSSSGGKPSGSSGDVANFPSVGPNAAVRAGVCLQHGGFIALVAMFLF